MVKPFRIFVGGSELTEYTDATLQRSKDELTGTLTVSLFMSNMPSAPVMTAATPSAEIMVYVGDNLAFNGKVDRRRGTGAKHGDDGTKESEATGEPSRSSNIGPDEYTVQITARGKTKQFVDSAHKHKTTNILRPSTRDVVDVLMEGSDVELEWLATEIKLDKVRLRDGAVIVDELQRVGNENAYFIYENREGNLRVTDDTGRTTGDPLILGDNVMVFSSEQTEEYQRTEIKVKGQRTPKEIRGKKAVIDLEKIITDSSSTNKIPVTIQHYGDATPEALERRANFEANKRVSASKKITIEVFNVMSDGEPWDVGNVHYVEIPPEGIFDVFECTSLTYNVTANDTIKTVLTLSPLPSGGISGGAMGTGFSLPGLDDLVAFGKSRRTQMGITLEAGAYPGVWTGADLSETAANKSLFAIGALVSVFDKIAKPNRNKPPKKLPPSFTERDR